MNIEHLLGVFTSIDGDSETLWNTCANFTSHLNWHKPRHLVLGSKVERLPDDHPSKPICLYRLSQLFASLGNYSEHKRAVTHVLKLCRELEDLSGITLTLLNLASANEHLQLYQEGIQQAKEGLEIHGGVELTIHI